MITKQFPPLEIDQDTQRRRALAKVYSLLIRLAENQPILPDLISEEKEKIEELVPIQADQSNIKV